jgi:hypothetical protein
LELLPTSSPFVAPAPADPIAFAPSSEFFIGEILPKSYSYFSLANVTKETKWF